MEKAKNGQYRKSKRRGNDESPYRVPKGRDHLKGAPLHIQNAIFTDLVVCKNVFFFIRRNSVILGDIYLKLFVPNNLSIIFLAYLLRFGIKCRLRPKD